MTLAIPFSRWGARPFITDPMLFPPAAADLVRDSSASAEQYTAAQTHPIHRAVQWHAEMQRTPGLKMSDIAKREGLTSARVTQIMHLFNLADEIREHLLGLKNPEEIRGFSERRLRAVAQIGSKPDQLRAFRKLLPSVSDRRPS